VQGDAYADSRLKDSSSAELLSKHAVSGSPQMLSGLSEAQLDAHKARLHADKARLHADMARDQARLLATDGELTRVDAEQRTRERVREDVDKRYPKLHCPISTSPLT
jgi:hypothetical protein